MKPFWNIVSLALPVAVLTIGAVIVATSDTRDGLAGGIGSVLMLVVAVGAASLLGEAAAIAALVKGERLAGLSILGVILNLLVIFPAAYLVLRMD